VQFNFWVLSCQGEGEGSGEILCLLRPWCWLAGGGPWAVLSARIGIGNLRCLKEVKAI
jgi:hypothetical protein